MPITFNTILNEAGLSPADVVLLRHKDRQAESGRSPYELWRDNPPGFDLYQSHQSIKARSKFSRKYWASFVGTPANETVFVGLYAATYGGVLDTDVPMPHMDGVDKAGTCDVWRLTLLDSISDLAGRLIIDWGAGALAWVQHADKQNKLILEVRAAFREPDFPGFVNFIQLLSRVDKLPRTWTEALRSVRGVYLLTCPKTKEHYVGSATGEEGLWGRWQAYVDGGDGGNVALMGRPSSDFQVSILEVAGTACTANEIVAMEERWKRKLMSKEIGLNR